MTDNSIERMIGDAMTGSIAALTDLVNSPVTGGVTSGAGASVLWPGQRSRSGPFLPHAETTRRSSIKKCEHLFEDESVHYWYDFINTMLIKILVNFQLTISFDVVD